MNQPPFLYDSCLLRWLFAFIIIMMMIIITIIMWIMDTDHGHGSGLFCCHDKTMLLDTDQAVPTKMDTWRMKYRFYFEEWANTTSKASPVNSTKNTFRVWWSTEASLSQTV